MVPTPLARACICIHQSLLVSLGTLEAQHANPYKELWLRLVAHPTLLSSLLTAFIHSQMARHPLKHTHRIWLEAYMRARQLLNHALRFTQVSRSPTCSSAAPPERALRPVRLPSKAKVLRPWLTNCPETAGSTPLQVQ